MPAWTYSPLLRLRIALIAQAVITGALAVGPLAVDRWLPFVAAVAAGSMLLAWFVGTATRSAWLMCLAFEVFAVAVGGSGAAQGEYVPGTLVGVAVIVLLVLPSGRALFPAADKVSYAAPVRLTPPPVVAAVPSPPAPPPPALLLAATAPLPPLPPPPPAPSIQPTNRPALPPPPSTGFSGNILPRR